MSIDKDKAQELYQEAVDGLDIKYVDGTAYMSVHTIDVINAALADIINDQAKKAAEGEIDPVSPDFIRGVVLGMVAWENLHDELSIREKALEIPDFIPEDFTK